MPGRSESRSSPWGHLSGLPAAIVISGLTFLVVGVVARAHWSCVFDEGFHLTRGLALRHLHDSRLSFFHPPLQNWLGAYFADLRFGRLVQMPLTAAWAEGNSFAYAVDVAVANPALFPSLVETSRWSATLFGVLLCATGVWWSWQLVGRLGGWLTGLGLALNPNVLAHGNLDTTDMGVTALALAGTALLWWGIARRSRPALAGVAGLFVLASLVKFTGLIWLSSFLFVVVPVLAFRWRCRALWWLVPATLGALIAVLLAFYGLEAQSVRDVTTAGNGGTIAGLPAGRFLEGVLRQSRHSLEGHRAWFHGTSFVKSAWWHIPAALVLKTPVPWTVAAVTGLVMGARQLHWRNTRALALLPAIVFAALLVMVNQIAIGVRHALPLVALGVVAGGVAVTRVTSPTIRLGLAVSLLLSSIGTAAATFPRYIGYFPLLFGGVADGHRWLVDSNYDWGQELPDLEKQWPALTAWNGGQPPNLIYFGFLDPCLTAHLPCGAQSYGGFMEAIRGGRSSGERLRDLHGLTVVSISALRLRPLGMRLEALDRSGVAPIARVGSTFQVFRLP